MSTTSQDQNAVNVDVLVNVPVEDAFRVFTERFDVIKPREHNLLSAPIERTVLECKVGGTAYDVGTDGSKCTWARVLEVEPPHRLVISWDISPRWQIETDHSRCSEVEITFTEEQPYGTRVAVEHRHLDRHGEGWQGFISLGTGQGWPLYLQRFEAALEQTPA
jgi:uncharacterized protein YndB with AHSA1/START domain